MFLFIEGVARHLPTHEWLEFLDRRTLDAEASPLAHGWEVGPVLGDLATLDFDQEFDRWEDVLVTEGGEVIALSADQWLAFVEDHVNDQADPLSEYGSVLGPIAPPVASLSPVVAKILAAGLRAALFAEYESPLPVDFEHLSGDFCVAA